ncbi:hypothetical protein LTR16_012498, partial [Cryomyces antarcticus]
MVSRQRFRDIALELRQLLSRDGSAILDARTSDEAGAVILRHHRSAVLGDVIGGEDFVSDAAAARPRGSASVAVSIIVADLFDHGGKGGALVFGGLGAAA